VRIVRYQKDQVSHDDLIEGNMAHELVGKVFEEGRRGQEVGALGEVKLLAPCVPQAIWSNDANYPWRCHDRHFDLPTEPHVLWAPGTMIGGPEREFSLPRFEHRADFGAEEMLSI